MQENKEYKTYTNYQIFLGKIRLVEEGHAPIIIERDDAIESAKSKGMDLVQIAYNKNDFPHAICKIMNYGKYLYEQKKKEKNAKKQARANEMDTKEVSFSIRIEDGDFNTKCKMIKKFLADNDKVKISVRLLRRETNLTEYAKDTMKKVLTEIDSCAELDSIPAALGNILYCTVRPKKK